MQSQTLMQKLDQLCKDECLTKDEIMLGIFEKQHLDLGLRNLVIALCEAHIELAEVYKKIEKINEVNRTYDDKDCFGFDEMEIQQFWEQTARKKCKQAKKAIEKWLQINIDKTPIVKINLEEHDDSECESGCDDCKERDFLRMQRQQEAQKNPYPNMFENFLTNVRVGTCFSLPCVRYVIDHGYIRDGITYQDTVRVHFVKKKNMNGMTWNAQHTECWFYYSNKEHVQLCPYKFYQQRVFNGTTITTIADTSQQDSVRILCRDVIFENWVHVLDGFIIPNEEIQNQISAWERKNKD